MIVYLLTKQLKLYSDAGSFFPTLQVSRDVSSEELSASFPSDSLITVYFDQKSAEKALVHKRKMDLVEDDNPFNQKGFTYRSVYTPVIFQVYLKNDLEIIQDETHRLINKDMIDFEKPVDVINLEKGYKGKMPASIKIETSGKTEGCTIL